MMMMMKQKYHCTKFKPPLLHIYQLKNERDLFHTGKIEVAEKVFKEKVCHWTTKHLLSMNMNIAWPENTVTEYHDMVPYSCSRVRK